MYIAAKSEVPQLIYYVTHVTSRDIKLLGHIFDWSIRPVMLGMRVCLIFSSIGPSNCEMLGVVLMRKDHLRAYERNLG